MHILFFPSRLCQKTILEGVLCLSTQKHSLFSVSLSLLRAVNQYFDIWILAQLNSRSGSSQAVCFVTLDQKLIRFFSKSRLLAKNARVVTFFFIVQASSCQNLDLNSQNGLRKTEITFFVSFLACPVRISLPR